MLIGFVPDPNNDAGGSFLYSRVLLELILKMATAGTEPEFLCLLEGSNEPIELLCSSAVRVERLDSTSRSQTIKDTLKRMPFGKVLQQCYRLVRRLKADSSSPSIDCDQVRRCIRRYRRLRRFDVDLMIYAYSTPKSFETGIPFIMPIHDLQHRLQPHFPEVSLGGEWERREYLFRNAARYATTILSDSEIGKEDILDFYGRYIDPHRIEVLPYAPIHCAPRRQIVSELQRVSRSYQLPRRYLFYPAQFWPHKNHQRIVEAVALLNESMRTRVYVVFCGSHNGEIRERTFQTLMNTADRLNVMEQITYLGYVPDRDMAGLYAGAEGLVMPTFFGPTNIPVLEAWALGCPVLTSDIRGIREQTGDAALLVNPASTEAIAHGMHRLWTDAGVCQSFAERGRARVHQFTPEEFDARFQRALKNAQERVTKGASSCRIP